MARKKPNITVRSIALASAFAVICLVFIIVMGAVQIKGPQTDYTPGGDNSRTVTVSGLRGEIYDKNGVKLVGNSTHQDLIYEYGAMPESFGEVNAELLCILEALELTGNTDRLSDDYFPLTGIYPDVRFVKAISDTASVEYYHFKRVLARNELSEDITAEELAKYYIKRCKLSEDKYSEKEISSLMRLWYEMDRVDFGQYQAYTVAEAVSAELVTYVREKGISGVTFVTTAEREYLFPGYASHILGRLGKITAENVEYYSSLGYPLDCYVGTSGCELAFESILHGQDGTMRIEYDDSGNVIGTSYIKEPVSGNDVYLTIDIYVQIAAEDALKERIDGNNGVGTSGAVTAIDPNTGAVLALASYPTYDLTMFSSKEYYNSLLEDQRRPLSNRALQGLYAPGSTYKIGVALAALELGYVDTDDCYICDGSYHGFASGNPGCNGVHDLEGDKNNIYLAIQESCNVFFYNLGHAMGINTVTNYTTRLGLGVNTGLELSDPAGTVAGSRGVGSWTAGDDVLAAIGQSQHAYSPLQLSVYMASIVNGGTRYSAHIFDSQRSFHTKEVISSYEVTVADRVNFLRETYEVLMKAMGLVVSDNSEVYRYFKDLPVTVGGKTGTAEKDGQEDNALFTGFAPLEQPEIVVTCIIEEGLHGYYASDVVAKVMAEYFKDLEADDSTPETDDTPETNDAPETGDIQ